VKLYNSLILIAFAIFSLSINAGVNHSKVISQDVALKLSDYGFFTNLSKQIPTEGVLPYDLNSALFSDYADKLRFVYVPAGGFAEYHPDEVFDFPTGSVLIKTFAYLNDFPESELDPQLLETRLLIRHDDGWKNVSYIWNKEQTDAYKSIAGKTISTQFVNEYGDMQDIRYRVPNINQCKECHQSKEAITPIGPKARNLNKDISYADGSMNQLLKWHQQGWIRENISTNSMVDWSNINENLDTRARSYLDINCGHCHIEGGSADTTGLYLNFTENRKINLGYFKKPIAAGRASNNLKYSIVPGNPDESILLYRMQSLDPGIMMPESGRALQHVEAVDLLRKWIHQL